MVKLDILVYRYIKWIQYCFLFVNEGFTFYEKKKEKQGRINLFLGHRCKHNPSIILSVTNILDGCNCLG